MNVNIREVQRKSEIVILCMLYLRDEELLKIVAATCQRKETTLNNIL